MYELQLSSQYKIHPTFHVSLLKPCHPPVLPVSTEPGTADEPPLLMGLEDGTTFSKGDSEFPTLWWQIGVPH